MVNKRDLSISMAQANAIVLFLAAPLAVVQFIIFSVIHGIRQTESIGNFPLFLLLVVGGLAAHELIHGLAWMIAGHKPFSAIQFGFQWKTLTPYAHLKEPVEVNAYRIGGFMPGLLLGILPYLLSLLTGNSALFWFSLLHTAGASGDFLILWLIRKVKSGRLVEDHPTHAGCYVIEP